MECKKQFLIKWTGICCNVATKQRVVKVECHFITHIRNEMLMGNRSPDEFYLCTRRCRIGNAPLNCQQTGTWKTMWHPLYRYFDRMWISSFALSQDSFAIKNKSQLVDHFYCQSDAIIVSYAFFFSFPFILSS